MFAANYHTLVIGRWRESKGAGSFLIGQCVNFDHQTRFETSSTTIFDIQT